MSLARRRIALLAALAAAASVVLPAPAASADTEAAGTATGPGVHQTAIDALAGLDDVDVFEGTGCADGDADANGDDGDTDTDGDANTDTATDGASDRDGDGFCEDGPLPRWEMAVWLVRLTERADATAAQSRYADVDAGEWWAPHAERLALRGIDQGCGTRPLLFCGDRAVTRAEAAGLLARAFNLASAEPAGFADVGDDHASAGDIDRLAAARITAGCDTAPARFCPQEQVTRGQMATLLARAAGLVAPASPVVPAYEPAEDPTLLPVDPGVVIGTLDNGLTYYLRHNDSPGKNLAVRLLVNVGSVDETDEQAGIGHFIEHMLFNGTAEFPEHTLGEALREIGVELGPDVNAHVGHDETVYQISVRLDEPRKAPLVFHALSQMAGAATFAPDAVESERGVVLDEMRFRRESVNGFISAEFDRVYTQGTPYAGRDPVGTVQTVNAMTAADLRAFYEKWYVPANMAVVVVGDMPTDEALTLVEEHFGPLSAGEPRQPPSVEIAPAESSSHVLTDPRQGVTFISLDIPIALHDLSTVGGDRLATIETVIEVMIQNRLNDAYHRGELSQIDPPSFITFTYNRGLRYYGTNWQGDNLDTASTDYLSVLLTAREHGFTAGDLQRAVSAVEASLEFRLDQAETTQDDQWAGLYQDHFFYGGDIDAVDRSVARSVALLAGLTPEELTDHFRWQMHRGGLLAIAVGPDPSSVPTVAELDAALAEAAAGPPPPEAAVIEQLMDAPEPAEPVSEGAFDLFDGGYEWTFANGTRVMFAPSDIAEGVVNLHAQSLGGWSQLAPGDRALSAIAVNAVQGSGLGGLSRSELNRFLEDSTASVSAYIGETSEGFVGSAGTDDIDNVEAVFQLIHLLVTAPQIDDQAYGDAVHTAETRLALAERDPRWQAAIAYLEARFGDTWHRAIASRAEIDSLTPPQLLAMYRRRLGSVDDMVVAVVGDIDRSEVERLARSYIATLPAGESDTYINRRPPMPGGVVQRQVQVGEGESAVLEIYHEADTEVTPLTAVAADVLEAAMSERVFLVIREELGASYVAGAAVDSNRVPGPYFDSVVFATLDPSRYDEIHATMLAILADVAANGLTPEEFAQATAIKATDYARSRNADLISALLARRRADDSDVATNERLSEELERLTPQDVQALAAALYGEGGRIEIARRP